MGLAKEEVGTVRGGWKPFHTGSQERWPSMFAHAMGHDVFRGTAGAAEGRRAWGVEGKRIEGGEKKNVVVWWPHVTVAAQCLDIADFHAKLRCRG